MADDIYTSFRRKEQDPDDTTGVPKVDPPPKTPVTTPTPTDPTVIDPGYGTKYHPKLKTPTPTTPANPTGGTGRRPGTGRPGDPRPGGPTDPLPPSTPAPIDSGSPILPAAVPQPAPSRTDTFAPVINTPIPVIYGSTRVGAIVFYDKVQPDSTRVVGYVVCWGQVNSISNVQIDGQPINGFVSAVNIHTGTAGQTVDAIGAAAEAANWTSGFPNLAYVVARFVAPQPGQHLPNVRNFLCDVQGLLVFDPRTDATLTTRYYRDNPALIMADYLISTQFGAAFPKTTVDWAGSVTTAANDCDALISDGVTKRYTMGVKLVDRKGVADTITYLRSHAALNYVFNSGLHQLWVDKSQAASGLVLTDNLGNDLAGQPAGSGANIVTAGPLVVAGQKQVPTRITVNFVNAAANYKDDTLSDDDPGIAGGTVEMIERIYDLGQVPYDQAKRLALQYRKRAAMDKSAGVKVLYDIGEQVLPGIIVTINSVQLNWSNQQAVVTDWQSTGDSRAPWAGRVELFDPAIYDDTKRTATAYAPPADGGAGVTSRRMWLSEVASGTVVPPSAAAAIGGRILVGPSVRLTADLAAGATTITVDRNALANGDRVYLEAAPGGTPQAEFMAVTSVASGTGPYTYTVTRDLAVAGAVGWLAGSVLFDTGQTGAGFIDLYSLRGTKSAGEVGPTIVGNVRNSATYNDWTPRWAVGNLNGLFGYVANIYGAAFGVPSGAWIKIDPTSGVRLGFNATTSVQIDASGNASFSGAITASSGTIGGFTIGPTELYAGSGATRVEIQAGGGFWAGADLRASAPFSVTPAGVLTASSGTIGGLNIGSTKIYVGAGTYADPLTGFYVDQNGNFSLKDKFYWNGTDLNLKSNLLWIGPSWGVSIAASANTATSGYLFSVSGINWGGLYYDTGDGSFHLGGTSGFGLRINGSNTFIKNTLDVVSLISINGTQVVSSRGAAVAHATNATDVITQLNALIDRLSAATSGHGLIA